jgi:DNA-binding PadR family transcriptional regulator
MSPQVPNATAASLLGFLHHGPMSGWDLAAVAQTVIGEFWSLTRSQVYRELERMAATGLVVAGEPEARNRRPFEITDAGRAAFAAWIEQEPGAEQIRFPLLLTVSFGRHLPPAKLRRFVEQHRRVHAERLADYEQQYAAATAPGVEPDPYSLATLEFGLAHERAVMDWFDRLPDRLPGWSDPAEEPGVATSAPP